MSPTDDPLTEQASTTVAETARAVGYSDECGFSGAFKSTRGVSPSDFRHGRSGAAVPPRSDPILRPDPTLPWRAVAGLAT
ncbi:helix-turn-helix domain-containing protein [Streptomyces sp. NPDC055078]